MFNFVEGFKAVLGVFPRSALRHNEASQQSDPSLAHMIPQSIASDSPVSFSDRHVFAFPAPHGEGSIVNNPIFNDDEDEEVKASSDSGLDRSPAISTPTSNGEKEERQSTVESYEGSNAGSMVFKSLSEDTPTPAFFFHPAAFVSGNEWEEILAKEEQEENADNDLEEIIWEGPSVHGPVNVSKNRAVELIDEEGLYDNKNEKDALLACVRCKVSVGQVLDRINAFSSK